MTELTDGDRPVDEPATEFERDDRDGSVPDGRSASDLAELTAAVADLAAQTGSHHARAAARERVIDQLHAEVERLRVGERGMLLRPVVIDLQRLRNELLHQSRTVTETVDRPQVVALLESFALSAEQALERCGWEPVRPSVGDPFVPREQMAVKIVEDDDPTRHDRIAKVISDGYREIGADRTTVPARVHICKSSPPPKSVEQPSRSEEHTDPGEHNANV